ncbi:hydrolase [Gracilimonas mengyeensis]|uniref:Uncharacterized protein n=1 Tax=Gracilimonas mengyeensis TaxID=1302730 RepID=A0A521E566_9BACT|nr:hydrolase [Gracilimonas mengyeensis]SMO79096.1 hypothetical protein SAMN06265219_110164 [Gracilimonas mengyeensis]
MKTNALPIYDMSDNPTGCCPRFKAEGWDGQDLHFDHKRFVKATTRSFLHIPLNMGSVFTKTMKAIEEGKAFNDKEVIILSNDVSPWKSEHLFAVTKDVKGQQMTELSGDYITKVFEGPYRNAKKWMRDLQSVVEEKGKTFKKPYFFYTTCPKCAKYYGKNYVVGVAEVE